MTYDVWHLAIGDTQISHVHFELQAKTAGPVHLL